MQWLSADSLGSPQNVSGLGKAFQIPIFIISLCLIQVYTNCFALHWTITKYITPSIACLYNRWDLMVIFSLPEGYKGNIIIPFHVFLFYSLLHCHAKVQILYTVVCKKDIEFVVNTCTCTDVFTILTSKNQSGGIYIWV